MSTFWERGSSKGQTVERAQENLQGLLVTISVEQSMAKRRPLQCILGRFLRIWL